MTSRLKQVLLRVKSQEPLWDIGCDHGHLGIMALQQKISNHVYFVDPASGSIAKLQANLSKESLTQNYSIYFAKGEALPWGQVTGTVVICGMGFRSIRSIWESVLKAEAQPNTQARFILGPHSEEAQAIQYFTIYQPKLTWLKENGRDRLFLEIQMPTQRK